MQDHESRPFACFAAAFALALVAHQLWWRGVPTSDLHGVVIVLAAAVLARPGSRRRFVALAAAEVVAVGNDLPAVGDHTLLAALTAAAFLAGGARWPGLAPFLRVQAVLLYAAAALAKLNFGFLDAARSCAAGQVGELLGPSATWAVGPAIPATIAAEAGLALLLAVPRTRTAGVVFGATFHAVLALAGNVPFAAYALALYVAFLPAAALPRPPGRAPLIAGAAGLWVVTAQADLATRHDVLGALTAVALLAFAVHTVRHAGGTVPRARLSVAYAVATSVLVLNAASPYLGLKTEASFAMFSNLQTEPGHWNHVIVPEAVRVFGLQDELVRLTSSNAAALERRRRGGVLMVRHELERFLRQNPGARATYVDARDPARRFAASAATLPRRPVRDRLLNFYDVRPRARGRC